MITLNTQKYKKINFLYILAIGVVVFISFVVSVSIFNSLSTKALPGACDASSKIDNDCIKRMYDIAKTNGYGGNIANFQDVVKDCEGFDAESDIGSTSYTEVGTCANAMASCYEMAIDTSVCGHREFLYGILTNDHDGNDLSPQALDDGINFANCSSTWDAPAFYGLECPEFANISNGNAKSNEQIKNEQKASYEKEMRDKCAALHTDDGKFDECVAAIMKEYDNCRASKDGADIHRRVDNNEVKRCTAYSKVTNQWIPDSCQSNGGIPINKDTIDPDTSLPISQRNTLKSGCYNQASDLTNPEACSLGAQATGKKYEWKQTNKAGQPTAWGCVDPDNPDGEENKDPSAQCLKNAEGTGCADKLDGGEGKCGQAKTNIISCDGEGAGALGDVLRIGVVVLSICVGIAAVGGIAWSSVQYASATDNQSNVSSARERIRNIIIGLLLYGFMVAIINWLVPGGIIG